MSISHLPLEIQFKEPSLSPHIEAYLSLFPQEQRTEITKRLKALFSVEDDDFYDFS